MWSAILQNIQLLCILFAIFLIYIVYVSCLQKYIFSESIQTKLTQTRIF
jgi:hypothetical protein